MSYDLTNNVIMLKANNFVKNMYLYLNDYSQNLKLTDNYFDMIPGETKHVKLLNGTLSDITSKLTFITLYDI